MAGKNVRWRNIREFLDGLPTEHCQFKPGHEFCTVCMRINYLIAHDCPLFHQKPRKKKKVLPPPPPPEARPEPIKDHISTDDVLLAMKGEDFPIIEFAGPRGTGGHGKEEDIFEVKPLDVKPIGAPPTEANTRHPKIKPKAATAKPATAVVDRDPETIVQEIMEELEFPDEDVLEDEPEAEKEPSKADEKEADDEAIPAKKGKGKSGGQPMVRKEAVKKRRPKEVK